MTAEQLKERREQQIRRLKESNAKRRLEKVRPVLMELKEIIQKLQTANEMYTFFGQYEY